MKTVTLIPAQQRFITEAHDALEKALKTWPCYKDEPSRTLDPDVQSLLLQQYDSMVKTMIEVAQPFHTQNARKAAELYESLCECEWIQQQTYSKDIIAYQLTGRVISHVSGTAKALGVAYSIMPTDLSRMLNQIEESKIGR